MFLKSELPKVLKTKSDAFRLGMSSRKDSKSLSWLPFDEQSEEGSLWIRGWKEQDLRMKS